MAAKRHVIRQSEPAQPAAPSAPPAEAEVEVHLGFGPSPVGQLQARLDAALAMPAPEPHVTKWPAATRLGILALGATLSWAMVLKLVSYLI